MNLFKIIPNERQISFYLIKIWHDISKKSIGLSNDEVSEVKSVNRSEFIYMIESDDFYDYREEYFEQIFELLR